MSRLIAIGDIHGEIHKLNSLLEKLNLDKSDTIVFLGDYIAIAYSDGTIFKNDKNDHKYMAASHAGITSDEIKVPLIIIEKPLPEY